MKKETKDLVRKQTQRASSKHLSPTGIKECEAFSQWITPMLVSFTAYNTELQKLTLSEENIADMFTDWHELTAGQRKEIMREAKQYIKEVNRRQERILNTLQLLQKEFDNYPEEVRERILEEVAG